MKKNISIIITTALIALNLIGCGETKQQSNTAKTKIQNATKQVQNDVVKIPKDLQADMGSGKFYISTKSGTSENGSVPILYMNKNTQLKQLTINTNNFNNRNWSYIFVDGLLNTKQHLSNSKSTINLKNSNLKTGKHRVDIVQFNNDKTNNKVITHKTAQYEIKSNS